MLEQAHLMASKVEQNINLMLSKIIKKTSTIFKKNINLKCRQKFQKACQKCAISLYDIYWLK
jgi:hypothetical protein